jgi:hypothetical protein
MRFLQWALWAIGLTLQSFVLAALLRGGFREFRALFVYVFVLLATTTADIVAFYTISRVHPFYSFYYWTAELMRQSALFALVVSLVIDVVPTPPKTPSVVRRIVGFAGALWILNLVFTWDVDLNAWMTIVVRNLSFVTAVLDLGVWFILISSGARDIRRLLIAGALGLQMTGEAIGTSVRQMFPHHLYSALAGMLFVILSHFLCLAIWWYAFARQPAGRPIEATQKQGARL